MKPALLIISGWGYGPETLEVFRKTLGVTHRVELVSAAEIFSAGTLPPAEAVVGWSWGAMLALDFFPVGCRRLVLISGTARFCAAEDDLPGVPERVLQRMIRQFPDRPNDVLQEFHRQAHLPRRPTPPQPALPWAPAVGLGYLRTRDLRERVASVHIPVLLIHGADDAIIPAAASVWLADRLPRARLILRPGEGHCLRWPQLIPAVAKFLEGQNP